MPESRTDINFAKLALQIKARGTGLGFQQVAIADLDLATHESHLNNWLSCGFHGEMAYMSRHGSKRSHPEELIEGTKRIITVRMDYWPDKAADARAILNNPINAYISRYALGRDYHKVIRPRLQKLAEFIRQRIGHFGYRVFVDSAPVLEKALAEKSGLGWIGKHTNLINEKAGSWFFLGELFTSLPLPVDEPAINHCGTCRSCMDVCPTRAIIAPYKLDARRCISYLTIELRGSIPVEFRRPIGNRIYGCDDCQMVCPWNRFSGDSDEPDFSPRHQLDTAGLIQLFNWDEETFLKRTEGSAIRRIGYECWIRNIAVALGNSKTSPEVIRSLQQKTTHASGLVREHTDWAIAQHTG
ncbi:MAG TPA: tRNA epoxyqueuosine(34) reductase QueG [Gammaproteobacteria bacterium]|nr:tRNA epoxyqueuosine(34) reductase QueG [Gammaproteobacteria bacterium]